MTVGVRGGVSQRYFGNDTHKGDQATQIMRAYRIKRLPPSESIPQGTSSFVPENRHALEIGLRNGLRRGVRRIVVPNRITNGEQMNFS